MEYRRVIVSRYGGPEVLQVVEEAGPEPAEGQVRVRVQAAGVSAFDLMLRRSGVLPGTPRCPYTPGTCAVGVVDALGAGVSSLELQQPVACLLTSLGFGGYATHLCLPAEAPIPIPGGLDPAEGVCLVVNYLTAHVMLHQAAKIQRGERILVHGAAGGVGGALLDLARLEGLEVYGTASAGNLERVRELGAEPIDYRSEDFVARVRERTGDGVDAVFDPIGGARQLWRSHQALRRGGRLVWFGVAATRDRGLGVIPCSLITQLLLALLPDGRRAPSAPDVEGPAPQVLPELFALLAQGKLQPRIAARLPLDEAIRAHELLEAGGHAGTVVLLP